MTDLPDTLDLRRHRDLEGRRYHAAAKWVVLGAIAAFAVAALLNVFGQQQDDLRASSRAADLELHVPSHLRSGLMYSARFEIRAKRDLKHATLVLDRAWVDGTAVNTIEPTPVGEASRDGRLVLELGHVPRGSVHVLWMQFQLNPTTIGLDRPLDVELDDGARRLLVLHHRMTVFP